MHWTELLGWITLGFIPAFLVLDLFYRAKKYQRPRWYRLRTGAVAVGVVAGSFGLAWLWGEVLQFPSLFNLSGLHPLVGAGIGILVYEFAHYWYHRTAHRFNWLWRFSHQTHHSTESHDAWGANYVSPMDFVIFGSLPTLVLAPLLGVSPESAAIVGAFVGFNAMFQHSSIKTPRWLGYIIQRPESHSAHHDKQVQHVNYSDLPLWDILFGTYHNPKEFVEEVGFWQGASAKLGAMWTFKDITNPPDEKTTRIIPSTSVIEHQRAA